MTSSDRMLNDGIPPSPEQKTTALPLSLPPVWRALLIDRTQAGIRRAKAEGKAFGRPSALPEKQRAVVVDRLNAGVPVAQIARDMKTSRQTIMRVRESQL
jgi:FixJ family two-component response regulator